MHSLSCTGETNIIKLYLSVCVRPGGNMADPIVYITRNRVKDGMLDNFRMHYLDSVPSVELGKSGTLVQLAYVNEDATEIDIIRVFPNAESMEFQLMGIDEHSKITCQYLEPTRIEIYGSPNGNTIDIMRKFVGPSIEVKVNPQFIDGFIRSIA
jgi:hypothetical protein